MQNILRIDEKGKGGYMFGQATPDPVPLDGAVSITPIPLPG
jgi:hypothetical protein